VPVPGQNASWLGFVNATSADAGMWDCVLTNDCGTVTSNAARLTINNCGTLYVDVSRPFPGGDGLSWAGAHTQLYTALERAQQLGSVREIRVAQGTYSAMRGFIAQRDYTHRLASNLAVLGGYPTGGAAARDAARWPVIVDGELQPGVFSLHVFHSLAATNVVLDGLIIQNGRADVQQRDREAPRRRHLPGQRQRRAAPLHAAREPGDRRRRRLCRRERHAEADGVHRG
jgi:hypothetical protein